MPAERKQVGLPAELVGEIDREAKRLNLSRTAWVEATIRGALTYSPNIIPVVTPANRPVGRPRVSKRNARPAYPKASKR